MNMQLQVPRPGPLVAIGGAEDRSQEAAILSRVMNFSGGEAPVVAVITTASSIPQEVFDSYKDVFSMLGAAEVLDLRIRDRIDAAAPEFVAMIKRADVIFISGGDQMRLTSILGGSPVLHALRRRHQEGAVIAGTSAGAACQSTTMVYGGAATDSLRKGAVKMAAGFGLVDGVIIDTHFLERGRFSRLMEVGATNPEFLGVGIGEDAAVLFDKNTILAFGPGHVILVDSSDVTSSNVFELDDGEAVSVLNVRMHALVDGYGYSLSDRRVLGPEELKATSLEPRIAYT
ncbi:cyanophycinase [Profundibacterium mesophilum]|uniref:Cyanophycinase n=1 Tax=Profundibacterium mesophilum KAUST100406-0324 TaxID=1037889 RepID=A0A921NZY3_9RHOB|nr:cyanophycinase [Profundibacterium mesophilum]KAF0676643.1 Cyanophycinase [Profundibacterium mesophilum KAUST100406-0324]